MNRHDCDALDALAAGHALGSLDADERATVRTHLTRCLRRHPSLREATALAALIGEALAAPCRPSASLRTALLDAVRAERRVG